MSVLSGLPAPPPVPVSAHLTHAGSLFAVFFDQELQPGPLADANWSARALNHRQILWGLHATGVEVRGYAMPGELNVGPDQCTYTATPPDVRSLAGTPADPFIGFPLQVHD